MLFSLTRLTVSPQCSFKSSPRALFCSAFMMVASVLPFFSQVALASDQLTFSRNTRSLQARCVCVCVRAGSTQDSRGEGSLLPHILAQLLKDERLRYYAAESLPGFSKSGGVGRHLTPAQIQSLLNLQQESKIGRKGSGKIKVRTQKDRRRGRHKVNKQPK